MNGAATDRSTVTAWPRTAARGLLLALGLLAEIGCSTPKPEPVIASAATEGGYAASYSEALQATALSFGQRKAEAHKSVASFASDPGELKDPDWKRVLEIIVAADRAGQSYAFVERVREVRGAEAFFDAERDEITRKVAGAAQYVVKKKNCDVDVQGAIAQSLKDTVEKQLEKRVRDGNEAERLIDLYRASLGKDNASTLEKQAIDVSFASYVVHVDLVETKLKLRRLLEDAEEVKKTADAFIAAERAHQNDKGVTDAEKKASEDRISAMNKSRGGIDAAVQQARAIEPGLEDQIVAAQKDYDDGLSALKDAIGRKISGK